MLLKGELWNGYVRLRVVRIFIILRPNEVIKAINAEGQRKGYRVSHVALKVG